MNVLFICSANKDRSRTAEDYFAALYPEINFSSAGTNKKICMQLGTTYLDEQQLSWADLVYVMETKHANAIKTLFANKYHSKVNVLHIKDRYQYGDSELKTLLKIKVKIS